MPHQASAPSSTGHWWQLFQPAPAARSGAVVGTWRPTGWKYPARRPIASDAPPRGARGRLRGCHGGAAKSLKALGYSMVIAGSLLTARFMALDCFKVSVQLPEEVQFLRRVRRRRVRETLELSKGADRGSDFYRGWGLRRVCDGPTRFKFLSAPPWSSAVRNARRWWAPPKSLRDDAYKLPSSFAGKNGRHGEDAPATTSATSVIRTKS